MINLQRPLGLLLTGLLLQACNAGPDTPRPVTLKPQTVGSPQKPASSISAKDREYAECTDTEYRVSLIKDTEYRVSQIKVQSTVCVNIQSTLETLSVKL